MLIEPLSTIFTWVLGICAIIFMPFALISFIVFVIKCFKDF